MMRDEMRRERVEEAGKGRIRRWQRRGCDGRAWGEREGETSWLRSLGLQRWSSRQMLRVAAEQEE
ncbi:hypothetical protein ACP70R_008185 [Stipagrostis hirtigluma subsp. patula]